ncbi:MAG: M13 family metallopeptidase N-terminal domain-containing protein, partial [Saprospiraceae bacterium]|nr:M13 family metallopeptidase N-terminal domain-containing protein [Saprospiraceae bacterium]
MKITKMYGWVLFLAFLCIYACKKTETTPFTETLDLSGRDTTMRPQDDFFSYANGNWVKNTEIPSDQSGWGSFYILGEENQKKTKTILEEAAAANAAKGSIQQKVGDFYASAMDTAKIEQLGYDPIKGELAKVDAIQNVQQMFDFLATQEYNRGGALFGMAVFADDKRSDINRLQFFQSGTGLPEKDYYFKNDDQTKAVRDAYVQYISNAFMLTGESDKAKAKQRANTVLKLETEFAKAHKSQVELRDPEANYHKFVVSEMSKQTPGINWQDFITKMNVTTDTILVGQPEYYIALDKLLKSTSIDILKDKIRFSIIDDAANYL